MSRIGKKPIEIPEGVEVKIEGQKIIIKGPKGELKKEFLPGLSIEIRDKELLVKSCPSSEMTRLEKRRLKAYWGTVRNLIVNMIKGVVEGFEKKLEIVGVGYRAFLEGKDLVLEVGFSHPVKIQSVPGIDFSVDKNIITVKGIDKELVGDTAAKVRKIKKPEPYKGKGIKYIDEVIRKKAGKKVIITK